MEPIIILETFTGRQVSRTSSGSVTISLCTKDGQVQANKAIRDGNRQVAAVGRTTLHRGMDTLPPDVGGMMVNMEVAAVQNTILKIHWMAQIGISLPKAMCFFIRVRQNAPLQEIEMVMSNDRNSAGPAKIKGRFDILTSQEVLGAGIPISKADEILSQRAIDPKVTIRQIAKEIKEAESEVKEIGEGESKATLVTRKRVRALAFRDTNE